MADTVEKAVIVLQTETGNSQQQLAGLKQATDAVTASAERLVVTEDKLTQTIRTGGSEVERAYARLDRSVSVEQRRQTEMERINRLFQEGVANERQRGELIDLNNEKAKREVQTLLDLGKAQDANTSSNKNAKAVWDALSAAVDKRAAAEQQMNERIKQANSVLQSGTITLREYYDQIQRIRGAYTSQVAGINAQISALEKSKTSTGLARYELINLSRQVQDVGVSLAGGQSPFRVLVEQGTQIADIFVSSRATIGEFFSQVASGAGKVLTPMRLAAGAVGIIGTAAAVAAIEWLSAQNKVQVALLGIGRASGQTAASIQKIADESRTNFGLSTSEAREFATQLAATGKISQDVIGQITPLGRDIARVLGTDLNDAAKQAAEALAEPGANIDKLAAKVGDWDAATVRQIKNLDAQGDRLGAAQLVMDGFVKAAQRGAEAQSLWSKVFETFTNRVSGGIDKIGEWVAKAAGFGQVNLDAEIERVTDRINKLNEIIEKGGGPSINMKMLKEATEEARRELERLTEARRKFNEEAEKTKAGAIDTPRAQAAVRGQAPEIGQAEELKNKFEELQKVMQRIMDTGDVGSPFLKAMSQTFEQVETSLGRAKGALDTFLTPVQRMTAEFEVQKKQIEARTAAQHDAAAVAQTELALAGQHLTASELQLQVDRARTLEAVKRNAAHKDTMAQLNDELDIAKAKAGLDTKAAQYQADINAGLRSNLTLEQAIAEAKAKSEVATANANKAVDEQLVSIRQSLELERARLDGTEAATRAAQAYENAMRSGADSTKAAALAAATLASEEEKLQIAAEKAANSMQQQRNVDVFAPDHAAYGPGGKAPSGGSGYSTDFFQGLLNALGRQSQYMLEAGIKFVQAYKDAQEKARLASTPEAIAAAAEAQREAAEAAKQAAEEQIKAAQAAQEAARLAANVKFQNIAASYLIGGMDPLAVNAMIESGQIARFDASTTFQTQLDLYKRAGVSNERTRADILSGIIGEGVAPTELLAALDSLTDAVTSNTDAQIGLSDFYTQQGDLRLGYRGYRVNTDPFAGLGGTTATGGTTTPTAGTPGVPYGGVINTNPAQPYKDPATGGATSSPDAPAPAPALPPSAYTSPSPQYYVDPTTGKLVLGYKDPTSGAVTPYSPAGYTSPTPLYYGTAAPGPIRMFAEGGVTAGPTFSLSGEYGPEAFIPLRGGKVPVQLKLPAQAADTAREAIQRVLVNINAPLVQFLSQPTRDEVRQSAYQAGQSLSRLIASHGG